MKIKEQEKAVRAGYDIDIIPSDLATYGGETKKLLEDLQSRNNRYIRYSNVSRTLKRARAEIIVCSEDLIMYKEKDFLNRSGCKDFTTYGVIKKILREEKR